MPRRSRPPTASSTSTIPSTRWRRVRALSPHIGAWTMLHGRRVTIWRARLEDGRFVPEVVQPEGRGEDELRRLRARSSMIAPARRAAYEVVRRVFEEDAYADRALGSAVAGLDQRDRALAQRLAYGTVQRARTLDFGIEQLGKRPVRKLDPPVRAALRLGAYQLAFTDQAEHAVVDDSVELVRAARLERAVPFTNAVMRRLAQGLRGLVASLPGRPREALVPRLDRRDLGARLRRRDGARADARPERAAALEVRRRGRRRLADRYPGRIRRGCSRYLHACAR